MLDELSERVSQEHVPLAFGPLRDPLLLLSHVRRRSNKFASIHDRELLALIATYRPGMGEVRGDSHLTFASSSYTAEGQLSVV